MLYYSVMCCVLRFFILFIPALTGVQSLYVNMSVGQGHAQVSLCSQECCPQEGMCVISKTVFIHFTRSYHLQAKLAEAKASLEETLKVLNESKARLREVEEGIASLQAKYEECVAKKQELGDKCDLCTARLERAEKVQYSYIYKDVIIICVCMCVCVYVCTVVRE